MIIDNKIYSFVAFIEYEDRNYELLRSESDFNEIPDCFHYTEILQNGERVFLQSNDLNEEVYDFFQEYIDKW